MACDYGAIRRDNERRYGTDIGRIGPMLLADRYDDRTHFIYELLQNAEDALARRSGWNGKRSVRFQLDDRELRISHFGKPFDEADVRGICGIAESTKELTAIGRFGIGFKSVYAFTDRPCIHSGSEDFAIESFVWPVGAAPIERCPDETAIAIPLRAPNPADRAEIASGLQRVGARTLLFLREVEEIEWAVHGGPSGLYLRSQATALGDAVRRVTLLGQTESEPDVEETWLVFSRSVTKESGAQVGYVEVAFRVAQDEDSGQTKVVPVSPSPLVVFFPTVLETHLGFVLQGPYRTTPSRDNVPRHDPWNQHCIEETAGVLSDALRWFRDQGILDAGALRTLPLESSRFGEGSMLAPLFHASKARLVSEALLPRFGGGYTSASRAKLGRSQELRELFGPEQITALYGADSELSWLSADISQDRTPELRQYLMRELEIGEVTAEAVLPRLTVEFLGVQPDDWILRLYEFLSGQPALRQRTLALPLIRLTDGAHVVPVKQGQPQAFLPGNVATGFPTVRRAVCESDAARAFLVSVGLTEPDPVDDVIWNVLPRYQNNEVDVSDELYDSDVRRVVKAFACDSKSQRERLLAALRDTSFVMVVDTGDASEYVSKPVDTYLSTERLKGLFAGVPGVFRVDDRYPCLRGEDLRELLEACGALRHLRPVTDSSLPWAERATLRDHAGHAETSGQNDRVIDWTLLGLTGVLANLTKLPSEERCARAELLWEELAHLEERRGKGVFTGEYTWTHYGSYRATFDAAFVRQLNETEWVPDAEGTLRKPGAVLFDVLSWKPNAFLQSKIRFRPPIVDQLAREAGIEPGVLDLLKTLGVTSEAELRARLNLTDEPGLNGGDGAGAGEGGVKDALNKLLGETPAPTAPIPDPTIADPRPGGGDTAGGRGGTGGGSGAEGTRGAGEGGGRQGEGRGRSGSTSGGGVTPGGAGADRLFISYVAAHQDHEDPDPDGLDQADRMAIEARAIEFILAQEPDWHRTPTHNPGFDLYRGTDMASATCWCEVKAMTGTLDDRPVGLSHTQFDCARERGDNYWLYVVERAGTDDASIVRIMGPSGKARTFTFDRGWRDVAQANSVQEERED